MRAAATALAALALVAAGCETPLQRGERLYRAGDRLAALEVWRSVPEGDRHFDAVRQRSGVVEEEFETLFERYVQRGRYFQEKGRLAESILDYRLALKLRPGDVDTLARVQELARELAAGKTRLATRYGEAMAHGDLPGARRALEELRLLDAFDPELETDERYLRAALNDELGRRLEAARVALSRGEYEAARTELGAALTLEADHEPARRYLAYIDSLDRAAGPPGAGGAPDPFAPDARLRAEGSYRRALAADEQGRPYAAIRHDLEALRADPQHGRARIHLTHLRAMLRERGELEALIEQGREAYQREDLQTALDRWRDALLIEPDDERARAYAARAERQLANLESLRAEPDVAAPSR